MAAPGKHRRREPIARAAVYALCDPGSASPTPDVVHYIGQTRHGLSARWRQHLRRPAGAVAEWLTSLDDEPVVLLLDDMAGANMIDLATREHDRIDEYRTRGAVLLNRARRPPHARPGRSDSA
jgi:pimeloyl-ACP methyl ester carboxylesterase